MKMTGALAFQALEGYSIRLCKLGEGMLKYADQRVQVAGDYFIPSQGIFLSLRTLSVVDPYGLAVENYLHRLGFQISPTYEIRPLESY